MYTVDDLLNFYRRAHNSLDGMLNHVRRVPWDKVTLPVAGFGCGSLRDTVLHIAGSEDFWLHHLRGTERPHWDYGAYQDMDQVAQAFEDVRDKTHLYLANMTDERLNAPVELVFGANSVFLSPALVLLHVITHAFHHKGQAVTLCRLHGLPAPETDLDLS